MGDGCRNNGWVGEKTRVMEEGTANTGFLAPLGMTNCGGIPRGITTPYCHSERSEESCIDCRYSTKAGCAMSTMNSQYKILRPIPQAG